MPPLEPRDPLNWERRFHIERSLLITGLISLAVMTAAAATHNKFAAGAAAFVVAVHTLVIALRAFAREQARASIPEPEPTLCLLRHTVRLSAFVCAWSAAALLLAYVFAGLRWQHGWQYGLAFAIAAVGLVIYFNALNKTDLDGDPANSQAALKNALRLTGLEAIAIITTLAWMTYAGKFATTRDDWLANDVFLAAGVTCLSLSIILVASTRAPRAAQR